MTTTDPTPEDIRRQYPDVFRDWPLEVQSTVTERSHRECMWFICPENVARIYEGQ